MGKLAATAVGTTFLFTSLLTPVETELFSDWEVIKNTARLMEMFF